MCGREMTTSSAWNSVETTGRVAKKQPLVYHRLSRLVFVKKENGDARGFVKSGLPSVAEIRQLYLHLPFPTVKETEKKSYLSVCHMT